MEGSFICVEKYLCLQKKWKIIGSRNHEIIPVGRDLREFLVQHPVPSRVNFAIRLCCSGVYSVGSWKPSKIKLYSLCVKAALLMSVLVLRTLPYNQSELLFSAYMCLNCSTCPAPLRRACPSLRIKHSVVCVGRSLKNLISQGHVAQGSIQLEFEYSRNAEGMGLLDNFLKGLRKLLSVPI